MRPSERLDMIDAIGRELQSKYTFNDIDAYFGAFGVSAPEGADRGSKWVYTKQTLRLIDERIVLQMAADLGLVAAESVPEYDIERPRNWAEFSGEKVFLSHLSKSKDKATRLKECLSPFGVGLFVAHEDILPTLEWQREIMRALGTMDRFISMHTPGFSTSVWCQQEVGFAIARRVPMLAIRMGEDPVGFQSASQALSRGRKTAEELSDEIALIWSLTGRANA